jgi:hypothetical protein
MRLRNGLFIAVLLAGVARAAPVGMFTDTNDIGAVNRATEASFEPATGVYTVGASGDNMSAGRDAFGFVWKAMQGDAAFAARIELTGTSAQERRKAGLMFRRFRPTVKRTTASLPANIPSAGYRPAVGA